MTTHTGARWFDSAGGARDRGAQNMKRRLLATLCTAASGSTIIGTGAFTSVEANRDAGVQVADDSSAYLTVTENDTSNGGKYAQTGSNGKIAVNFNEVTGGDAGASGLNDDAVTIIRDVLTAKNQGTQRVPVRIAGMPDGMSAFADDFDGVESQYEPFGVILNANIGTSNIPLLDPGDSLDEVGSNFKTGDAGSNLDDFDNDIVIEALTNDETEAENKIPSG